MSKDAVSTRRVISLDHVRADGWFERVGENSPQFAQVCNVMGDKFVAFAILAGVRINALTVDARFPDASLVDFSVGETEGEQRMPLGEFRRRLVAALLGPEPEVTLKTDPASVEELQSFVGFRYVLLAPLFGIRLLELRLGAGHAPSIVLDLGLAPGGVSAPEEATLEDFRELIRERVRSEDSRYKSSTAPFSIDLNVVLLADKAMREGDVARVVELLGAWPGPLSMLLRSPEGQQLTAEVKSTLARALGLLGTAYVHQSRFDWADEVLRLGIQWGHEEGGSADLYRRLGESYLARGRHGEAIGLLRRAITLGAPQRDVLAPLAKCYAARKRYVAAAACLDEAIALDVQDESLKPLHEEVVGKLGPAYSMFRELVPTPRSAADTLPAPAKQPA